MNVLERFFSGCRSAAELEQLLEVVADLASATGPRVRLTIETGPAGAFVQILSGRDTAPRTWETYVDELRRLDALCPRWGNEGSPDHFGWWGELDWPRGEVAR